MKHKLESDSLLRLGFKTYCSKYSCSHWVTEDFADLHGGQLIYCLWSSRKQLCSDKQDIGELWPVAGHVDVQTGWWHQCRLVTVWRGLWEGDLQARPVLSHQGAVPSGCMSESRTTWYSHTNTPDWPCCPRSSRRVPAFWDTAIVPSLKEAQQSVAHACDNPTHSGGWGKAGGSKVPGPPPQLRETLSKNKKVKRAEDMVQFKNPPGFKLHYQKKKKRGWGGEEKYTVLLTVKEKCIKKSIFWFKARIEGWIWSWATNW